MNSLGSKKRQGVGVGRVELVPEPPLLARLRENIVDLPCRILVLIVLIAQAADTLTTAIGLSRSGYAEENVLLRPIASNPVTSLVVKLGAVAAVLGLALVRLPTRRARVAVGLALGLSVVGPLLNMTTLLGR